MVDFQVGRSMCSRFNFMDFVVQSGVVRILTVFVASVIVAGLLAACGSESKPVESSSDQPTSTPATAEIAELTPLQTDARALLAERLAAPADNLKLISDDAVQWSDASLGCPQEGVAYAQVITPGRRITFSHNGERYEVHTGDQPTAGSQPHMVSCEGGNSY